MLAIQWLTRLRQEDCWAQSIQAQPGQPRESLTKQGDFLQTGQIYIQRSEIHKKIYQWKLKKTELDTILTFPSLVTRTLFSPSGLWEKNAWPKEREGLGRQTTQCARGPEAHGKWGTILWKINPGTNMSVLETKQKTYPNYSWRACSPDRAALSPHLSSLSSKILELEACSTVSLQKHLVLLRPQ